LRQRTAAFKATGEKAVTDKVNNNIKDINSISKILKKNLKIRDLKFPLGQSIIFFAIVIISFG